MNNILLMVLAFFTGIALGIFFFGGLWFTVKRIVAAKTPSLWVVGSFIIRMGVVLSGFYFIGAGNWQRLVICLVGFIVARFLVIRFTKTLDAKYLHLEKEYKNEA